MSGYNIRNLPHAKRLRFAVRAAVTAFEKSGRMLDAALAYAEHGVPIFPLDPRSKKPIPRRDRDPTGKYPKGIPATGGLYKATTDRAIIRAWWQEHPNALIGLPMGERTGVWTLDVDTGEDHADGVAEWNKIVAQHTHTRQVPERRGIHHHLRTIPPFITREHRSATGGPHIIFNWHTELPIGCGSGGLPDGISVKGQGGYIVAPPSRRKSRSYIVHNDIDPAEAPQWLLDLILQGSSPNRGSDNVRSNIPINLEDLVDAMPYVPNDNLSWEDWTKDGLALFADCGEDIGWDLFDAHSQKSPKYDPAYTRQRWEEIKSSPPNRTGVGRLFKRARANGWVPKLHAAEPTHTIDGIDRTADAARDKTREVIREFLATTSEKKTGNVWLDYAAFVSRLLNLVIVWAMNTPTGIGKTQITIEELAIKIRAGTDAPYIYAVPRHKLGHNIEQQFAAHGIRAKVFRGRGALDPDNPGKEMCLNPGAVELAMKCHADITATCCKSKRMKCRFFERCGYQRQMRGDKPDIWIVAGDMLFHTQQVFGEPAGVIIDEAIWKKGLRGIERDQYGFEWTVAIDSLLRPEPEIYDLISLRNSDRNWLGKLLQQQPQNGGVERQYFADGIGIKGCNEAIRREWKCLPKIVLRPGMSNAELKRLARNHDLIDAIQHARRIIRIWEAVRELLENPETTVSGRLTLKQRNGQRVVEWRGVAPISAQFLQPTLLLDATLPDRSILQVYHPQVEVVADIKVAMPPHVRVQQILQAPTSSNKLDNKKHLDEVYRYILRRFIEIGRQPTLVIC
jgi:Bifunctional DNA primase/polymerase, N-terminal/Primase C terminal 2 (PriCT-2)